MKVFLVVLLLLVSVLAGGFYLMGHSPATESVATTQLPPPPVAEPKQKAVPAADDKQPIAAEAAVGQPLAASEEAKTAEAPATVEVAATDGSGIEAPTAASGSLFPANALQNAEATLCYFSFNRPVEFVTVRNLVAQLNAHSPIKINVVELVSTDENIKESIRKAVASGIRCDGVVLTGHHRGKFWGDRTSGSVKAKFIEELSCDSRYEEWFSHVKALWMEGCHTGTNNPYNDEVDGDKRLRGSAVNMMRAHLDYSDMRGSIDDMNDVIEENLSEENIANDYQRIFPYATIFGWSGYAPGEKAGSHYSFPYHIAQVSHLADPADQYFVDPMHGKLTDVAARRYSEVLYGILKRPDFGGVAGWPAVLDEATFIKGWYNHGNFKMKYSLDNGALVTRKGLVNSDTELLRDSRALRCVMYQPKKSVITAGGTLNYLTSNESLTPFASELLLAMAGKGFSGDIREKLSRNRVFKQYLNFTAQSGQASEFRRSNASTLLGKLGSASAQQAQVANDDKDDAVSADESKSTADKPAAPAGGQSASEAGKQVVEPVQQTKAETQEQSSGQVSEQSSEQTSEAEPEQDKDQPAEQTAAQPAPQLIVDKPIIERPVTQKISMRRPIAEEADSRSNASMDVSTSDEARAE